MHHHFFEEWRAEEGRRQLELVDRHGWKLLASDTDRSDELEWRLCATFRSLRICLTLRREGHAR